MSNKLNENVIFRLEPERKKKLEKKQRILVLWFQNC